MDTPIIASESEFNRVAFVESYREIIASRDEARSPVVQEHMALIALRMRNQWQLRYGIDSLNDVASPLT